MEIERSKSDLLQTTDSSRRNETQHTLVNYGLPLGPDGEVAGELPKGPNGEVVGGLLGGSDGEVEFPNSRLRRPTERYAEWQVAQCQRSFHSAILSWRRSATAVKSILSESPDVETMRRERDRLSANMAALSLAYDRYDHSLSVVDQGEGTGFERFESVEKENHELVKRLSSCLKQATLDASDLESRYSSKSHSSRHSRRSDTSERLDAAAHAAVLKVKLERMNVEERKRIELERKKSEFERAKTMTALSMAEAKLEALSKIEEGGSYREFCKPQVETMTRKELVESYLKDVNQDCEFDTTMLPNPEAPEFVPKYSQNTPVYISQPVDSLMSVVNTLTEQISINRLPPPEPGIPPQEKVYYLRKYLGGAAREAVEGYLLLTSDDGYDEARHLLDERYGNSFVIASAFRSKLDSWPKILVRDGVALRKFADFLRQCLMAMRMFKSLDILGDEQENRKMLLKVPEWLMFIWGRIVIDWRERHNQYPPFSEFVTFVSKEAKVACDPVMQSVKMGMKQPDLEIHKTEKRRLPGHRTFATDATSSKIPEADTDSRTMCESNSKSMSCVMCDGKHSLDECRIFLSKDLQERKSFAMRKGLCFGCFGRGQKSKFCRQRKTCKTCSKSHPSSLHGDIKKPGESTMPSVHDRQVSVSHMSSTAQCGKCSVIVPVMIHYCDNPERELLVYALLDTQSDTTFILSKTCEALGAQGPHVKLLLSTMTSENQPVSSRKIDGLVVRAYSSELSIRLPATYSREVMPSNRSHIPTPEMAKLWPHLEKIADKLMPLADCPIGLLIGYNCARALAPREVIAIMGSEPYGQKTDLGWGIVGVVQCTQDECINDKIGVSHHVVTRSVSLDVSRLVRGGDIMTDVTKEVVFSFRTSVREIINPLDITMMMNLDFNEKNSSSVLVSQDNHKFLSKVSAGIHVRKDGHYEMPLPFRELQPSLPNDRSHGFSQVGFA